VLPADFRYIAAVISREDRVKMRICGVFCLGILFLTIPSLSAPQAVVDQPSERQTKRVAYVKRMFVDAYEANAKKDPKWDALAHDAVAATARLWSDDPASNDDEIADMFNKSGEAMEAGCDDALIHFARARSADAKASRPLKAREYDKAAQRMLESKYPPYTRADVLLGAASWTHAVTMPDDPAWQDNSEKYMDAAMAVMPQVVADPQLPPEQLLKLITTTGAVSRSIKGDRLVLVEKVMAMLEKSPHPKSVALATLGEVMIVYAWDARGSGYANTVTPQGWKLFGERIALARKLLDEAWKLDPNCCDAATAMLTVMKAQSRPRAEMEMWFKRAMKLDPCNKQACIRKMDFLDPKWGGPRPAGRFKSTAWIPGNFLAEGAFLVSAFVATAKPFAFHLAVRDAVGFHVTDPLEGGSARGDWDGEYPGVVRPLLPWTTVFNSDASAPPPP